MQRGPRQRPRDQQVGRQVSGSTYRFNEMRALAFRLHLLLGPLRRRDARLADICASARFSIPESELAFGDELRVARILDDLRARLDGLVGQQDASGWSGASEDPQDLTARLAVVSDHLGFWQHATTVIRQAILLVHVWPTYSPDPDENWGFCFGGDHWMRLPDDAWLDDVPLLDAVSWCPQHSGTRGLDPSLRHLA